MRHIMDHEWEYSEAILLGACFIGIVVFALLMGGF